jgi:hypothetical protein
MVFCFLYSTFSFGQSNAIVNGDFEMGDLSGWSSMVSGDAAGWNINDGSYVGLCVSNGPLSLRPPIAGNYDVISDQTGPGMNLLSSVFSIPSPLTNAVISWDMLYDNSQSVGIPPFQDPNQEFRVMLLDASMMPIAEVWSTDTGDPLQVLSPLHIEENLLNDLAGMEGQMAYLLFQEDDDMGCFNVVLDNVSLVFNARPIPTLSIWGVIISTLLIIIFSVVQLQQKQVQYLRKYI